MPKKKQSKHDENPIQTHQSTQKSKDVDSKKKLVVDEDIAEDDLLGGLIFTTTEEIELPSKLIDQVIGQDRATEVIQKAASQHRHVMMIGSPGTGKSMLAKAMAELLPKEELQDVLVYENPDDKNVPKIRTVPTGKGQQIIDAHKEESKKQNQMRSFLMWIIIIAVVGYSLLIAQDPLLGILAAAVIYIAFKYSNRSIESLIPNLLINNAEGEVAPFHDATGSHAGALLGDVRHDPFQSGGMETPAHDRVEAGAIHKAHKGVLFIDEINTLEPRSQQMLMTAIQERKFSITGQSERSSGAMVQTEPVPTDFIMVAAGNLDAMQNMHPALRNRIKGYGYELYMDNTTKDTPETRRKYVQFVAQEVKNDGRIPHFESDAVRELMIEAQRRASRKGHLTLGFRALGGLIRAAGDLAQSDESISVTKEHVIKAKTRSRSIEQQLTDEYTQRRKDYALSITTGESLARVNGLAIMGDDSGIVLPVMAEVTPTQGRGKIIATGQLQKIATESIENVSAIIKKFSKTDLSTQDIHVQFVQSYDGIEGDSASVTVATAVISALEQIPVKQNLAMTGSLSIRGDVLPVGGVTHKIEAAARAGISSVIIPQANEKDVMLSGDYQDKIELICVSNIREVLDFALVNSAKKDKLLKRFKSFS
jgi:Lon-like ATP-dependent protease